MRQGSRIGFGDAVGSQFLATILTSSEVIKERHDSLEFLNNVYLRHHIRVVVAVDRIADVDDEGDLPLPAITGGVTGPLRTWQGRVVLSLGLHDRYSRATTHVTNESGDMVPLMTAREVNLLTGDGLVSYAARALRAPVPPPLETCLRDIPLKASRRLAPATPEAAREAFREAYDAVESAAPNNAVTLFNDTNFRHALQVVTNSTQLVVAIDPSKGPARIFSYAFERPLLMDVERRGQIEPPGPIKRRTRPLHRFWKEPGGTHIRIELGPVGGCERYQLNAESPLDTWFARGTLKRQGGAGTEEDEVDTSQLYRLHYTLTADRLPWLGELGIEVRSLYTGVARTSVYASAFLAACALGGTIHVLTASDHTFLKDQTDAGASLLLLFPGIAASVVAAAARHSLTATIQFPLRLTLWAMSTASFVLAAATAVRLSGLANELLWGAVTAITGFGACVLKLRSSRLQPGLLAEQSLRKADIQESDKS